MPRVTVIMATYNWAPVLPFAIGSVLDQDFADFELLVIGDGCTDESAEVVGAIDDERVRWHNLASNTRHQSGPNSEGLAQASGDLIAYLGHDDLWSPTHLAALVESLDTDVGVNAARVVHASLLMVDSHPAPYIFPAPGWTYEPGAWVPPTSVMHDRELGLSVGGWRPPSASSAVDPDADLWTRMAEHSAVRHVDRLTSVKLSSAHRRNVYRIRPSHEQAYWLERIRCATDPERELRSACGQPYLYATRDSRNRTSCRDRIEWSIRTRWRRLVGRTPVTSTERIDLRRRYKGLD